MRLLMGGEPVSLRAEDLLGEGGEARVFAHRDLALKVYRRPDDVAPSERVERARLLDLARTKLACFPAALPPSVVAPKLLLTRPGEHALAGYAMDRVEAAVSLASYARPRWCAGRVEPGQTVALLRQLHALLTALHARQVVVGDLAETNVLVAAERVFLIDADSMQFAGLPCPVAQERTLDPTLYGVDLTARPAFSAETDWYAFAVLVVAGLLFAHPYGGTHPRYATLLRRAEARHSIFRGDVTLSKAARPAGVLPEALRAHLESIFDEGRRGAFPTALLDMAWQRCACGLVFAGASCPCGRRSARPSPPARVRGRCRAVNVVETRGRLLDVAYQGGLCAAVGFEREVAREDGVRFEVRDAAWVTARVAGRTTWVGVDGRVEAWRDGALIHSAACDAYRGAPAFDASEAGAFGVSGGWLTELRTGRRFGQVMSGQTWIALGPSLGAGLYRAGRLTVAFVFDPARPGLRPLAIPHLEGQLLELAAAFDRDRVLLELATETRGRRQHALYVGDREGNVLASLTGTPEAHAALAFTGGKAIVGDRVLYARDDGLGQLHFDRSSAELREGPCFPDAEPFVTAASRLIPGPGGTVYVAEAQRVLHLTLIPENTP